VSKASPVLLLLLVSLTLPAAPAIAGGDAADRSASPDAALRLQGRHCLSLNAGVLSRTSVESSAGVADVESEVTVDGPLATLSYAYWVGPQWNLGLGVSLIGTQTSSTVSAGEVSSGSTTVGSFLFGAAYYPSRLAMSARLRPFCALALGPYLGSATSSRVGTTVETESISATAFGVRAQVGLDWFFGRRGKAGVVAGYNLVTDFDERIGDDENLSGPEVSLGLGILLGDGG
jgi:hypothetical protein